MLPAILLLALAPPQHVPADEHYRRGTAYFQSGRHDDALAEFEQLTELAPADARGWKGVGVVHAAHGNYRQAEAPLRRACELDERDQDACYYFGLASYNLGRYDNSIAAYRKALRSSSPAARVRSGLGLALEAAGRVEEAERELREAVKLTAANLTPGFDPHVELGAFLFRQGRLKEAQRALERAVALRPNSSRAHFELGKTLVQFDRLDAAARHLERAVQLDSRDAAAHLLLGRVYYRLGREADGDRHTNTGRGLNAQRGSSTVRN
jgi:tetratricopeptide (TPR) repeat protein